MKRYIRTSADPRKNTNRLLEMIDNHLISKETVIAELLTYLSDDAVGEVMDDLGLNDDEDEE